MSKNLAQIFAANPITTIGATDLLYVVTTGTTDAAINGAHLLTAVSPLTTKGDLFTFSTVNARLGVGASDGQILQVSAAAATGIAWSTATYPVSTTINRILYSTNNNVIGELTTANTSVLTTNGSGLPGFTAFASTGATFGGTSNIMARDANGNTSANNFIGGTQDYNTNAQQTLTASSSQNQVYGFLASGNNVILPDATTLPIGTSYTFNNNSGGIITVKQNGGSTVAVLPAGSFFTVFLLSNSFPSGTWDGYFSVPDGSANQILITNSTGAPIFLNPTNSASLVSSSTGVPTWSGTMTNGQVIIGSTGATPTAATLSAGTGINITDGAGSITIASTGVGSLVWNDVSGTSQAAAVNNGYIISNAGQTTVTIPATAAEGSVFAVQGKGAAGWLLQMNTGQTCHFGSSATTSAGSLTSTNQWDSVTIVCVTANTTFAVTSVIGNLTIA